MVRNPLSSSSRSCQISKEHEIDVDTASVSRHTYRKVQLSNSDRDRRIERPKPKLMPQTHARRAGHCAVWAVGAGQRLGMHAQSGGAVEQPPCPGESPVARDDNRAWLSSPIAE